MIERLGAGRLRGIPAAVRVGVAILVFHVGVAWWMGATGTFGKYTLAAEQLLAGDLAVERIVDFSPLYLFLAMGAVKLFGNPADALRVLQVVLFAVAGGMFYAVLRRRFTVGLAVTAVGVMTIDRQVIVNVATLEPETCLLFFLIGFLFFLHGSSPRPAVAGICAALCLATRPNLLVVFLLVPLCLYLGGLRGARAWRSALAFGTPLVLAFALLAFGAWKLTGDARTPVMNPGTVFFEGNNPLSHGTSAMYPPVVLATLQRDDVVPDAAHDIYRNVARVDAGRELTVGEVNAFWARRALRFIADEPGRFAGLLFEKFTHIFREFPWYDVPTAWRLHRKLVLPFVPFGLVSALALAGCLLDLRRWRESLLFYLIGLAQVGAMLVFYTSARQRFALMPVLLYFGAAAVQRVRERRLRSAWVAAPVVALAVFLVMPGDLSRDERYRRSGYVESDRLLAEIDRMIRENAPLRDRRERLLAYLASVPERLEWIRPAAFPQERASIEAQLADYLHRETPRTDSARFDRAVIDLEAGRLDVAERALQDLVDRDVRFYRGAFQCSEPLFYSGRVAARRGDATRAIGLLESALRRSPGNPFVLADLVALTDDPRHRDAMFDYWSALDAHLLLGRAFLYHGRADDAAPSFGFVVDRLPDDRQARVLLAATLGRLGRHEEGVRHYREAMRHGPEPVLQDRDVVDLFEHWSADHPGSADVQYLTAKVLHQCGRLGRALELMTGIEDPPESLRSTIEIESRKLRAEIAAAE